MIHNIFQKTEQKKDKQEFKEKIIIDYREKNSFVPSELVKIGFEVEFKELKIGDYIIKDIIIERKTTQDFISSMISKRLFSQIEELKQIEKKLLIIEGNFEETNMKVNFSAIKGLLLSISIKHKIPLIFSKDAEETAEYLKILSKKQEKEISLNVTKKNLTKQEELQFILESFPKIGPKTAKKLLEIFGSIEKIINAKEDELKKVLGSKTNLFLEIVKRKY
jgi:Fanconi anemia group M protein